MASIQKSKEKSVQLKEVSFSFLADRPDAIPMIAKWYFEEWGHVQPGNSFEATCEKIKEKLNRDKPPLHVIATCGSDLLGVAQLKLYEMPEYPDKEFWLGSVFVAQPSRGIGIALGLCQKVSEVAKSFGIEELYLSTEHLDGGVYARAGWVPYERTTSRGDEVLVMVKKLGV